MKIKYRETKDERVSNFNDFIKRKYPEFLTEVDPDIILVAGGDGAMLHAIQENIDLQVPFFGKARGTFNFLMNSFNNNVETIQSLKSDKCDLYIVETGGIAVSVNGEYIGNAVNEVLIGDSINGYHEFNITTSDNSFNKFKVKGSGICVSTPLGSTAYNFNNEGSILPIGHKLWILSGIVCNQYLNDLVNIQKIKISVNSSRIFLDGIEKTTINNTSQLRLTAGRTVRLAFLNKQQFLYQRVELSHRLRK